jgi:polyisoprenoid-binding protein YceI
MRRASVSDRPRPATASESGGILTLVVVIALVVVVAVGAFWWFFVRSDAEPAPELSTGATVPGGTLAGTWEIKPTDQFGSYVQYRVKQQLAAALVESDATGRTPKVTATMKIDGTAVSDVSVEVQMDTLESDKQRRDEKLATDGLQTNQFPTATFTLTEPVDLGSAPAKGRTITVEATGDLTLHGVTRRVTVPLEGRWDGETVEVVGRIPIEFADYDITPPNIGGFVTVADKGRMELKLIFLKR